MKKRNYFELRIQHYILDTLRDQYADTEMMYINSRFSDMGFFLCINELEESQMNDLLNHLCVADITTKEYLAIQNKDVDAVYLYAS